MFKNSDVFGLEKRTTIPAPSLVFSRLRGDVIDQVFKIL